MDSSKSNSNSRNSCTNCSVERCKNKYSNTDNSVKFYCFPGRPYEKDRRRQWINAVRTNNTENHTRKIWEPKPYSRICSNHFIGNAKSNHPHNAAYIPTIFPKVCKTNKNAERSASKVKGFKRDIKRTAKKLVNQPQDQPVPAPIPENAISQDLQISCSTQDNFDHIENSFLFECEHYNNNEVGTSCNITTNNHLQTYVEECVGPNSGDDVCAGFHGSSSITTDDQLISLTGVNFTIFSHILGLLAVALPGDAKISVKDRLFIFLMKIKLGISYSALGIKFGIHRSTVQLIFLSTLEELTQKMKNYVFWPSRDIVSRTMPDGFKIHYPNCRVIIDCSEIRIQQPTPVENRIFTYSDYKGTLTAKFLIGITPSGFVSFISNCYGGRSSDGFITNNCGLLELLEKGDLCLADKSFSGVKCEYVIIVMPPFLHDGRLSEEEVGKTYNATSVRTHVERTIQRVKIHNILNNFTNDLLPIIDQIVLMCCILANLQSPIIKTTSTE